MQHSEIEFFRVQARDSLTDMAFLNCRPSVIGAAILYVERRAQGMIPFWPTMLAKLTGYQVGLGSTLRHWPCRWLLV